MKCGNNCAYAWFSPVNLCYAPFAVDDNRRKINITPETECFAPKYFIQTDNGKRRNEVKLYQIAQAQKGKL